MRYLNSSTVSEMIDPIECIRQLFRDKTSGSGGCLKPQLRVWYAKLKTLECVLFLPLRPDQSPSNIPSGRRDFEMLFYVVS